MTAQHLVQLSCEGDNCTTKYPAEPVPGTVADLRERAASAGWEVMRGRRGRDACPQTRIREIRSMSNLPTREAAG